MSAIWVVVAVGGGGCIGGAAGCSAAIATICGPSCHKVSSGLIMVVGGGWFLVCG